MSSVSEPDPRNPLVIVGDSFAKGVGASSVRAAYPARLSDELDVAVRVVAAGACGFVSRGPSFGPLHPRGAHSRRRWRVPSNRGLLLLQGSGNDRLHSVGELREAMRRYLDRVPGDNPVVLTGAIWAGNRRHLLPIVGEAAAEVAAEYGHHYLHVSTWFGEEPDPAWLAADGGHPSDEGHARIAICLASALRGLDR